MVEDRRKEDSTVVKLTQDVSKIQQDLLDKLLLDMVALQQQDNKIEAQVTALALVASRVDTNTTDIIATWEAVQGAKKVLLWVAGVMGAIATIVGGWYAITHLGSPISPDVLPALVDFPK